MAQARQVLMGWAAALATCCGPLAAALPGGEPQVLPPPFMDGLFPCTRCHDGRTLPTNTRRRTLEDFHENIVLNHLGPGAWCFSCHDPKARDALHLATGEAVPFTASYRLCGQCHVLVYKAWREGRHGQDPEGGKALPLCVRCHNPHSAIMKAR